MFHSPTLSRTVVPPQPAAPPAELTDKRRDPYFDNAKYLAIVLVAMGHAWEPLLDGSRAAEALYMVVYAFHMPAFIVISGYFSRGFEMRPAQLRRLVGTVVVPFVVFEVAYSLFYRWAGDAPSQQISLLDPQYLTWFLAALFVWRLTTPLWRSVHRPLLIAVAIAVLASVTHIGKDLDLQRILQFLPFFVAGLYLRPEHFEAVRRRAVRLLALPVFAGALVAAYWAAPRSTTRWLYHTSSAQELGQPWWTGAGMTLVLLAGSALLSVCFLAWVPRRKMWFTALGAGTLSGYLLHGFLVKGSGFLGWYETPWLGRPLGLVALTAVAAVLVTAMCTPPVRRALRCVLEPRLEWAFKGAGRQDSGRERSGVPVARQS
ncbi:acyltransferase family protein [Streptomyces sp. A3M-1-3]|uniref:acyltransferase family protein n=1 Tax=Streptomyces sp. A3M-1-3 TaxID=2962044 RepID=UPI0020B65085|nr:acyltransferase family protein [Streptomyces sp. A3M-1-3]MCP3817729.1 acyltransferase family protein [Streptomyces sp. A3M-1-3]